MKPQDVTIAIVDDNPVQLRLMESILRDSGYHVINTFSSSEGVLDDIGQTFPDIVLTDLHLEGMNGFELSRHLKDLNNETYIICITGDDSPTLQLSALAARVTKCLSKGGATMKWELVKAINECAEMVRKRRELAGVIHG